MPFYHCISRTSLSSWLLQDVLFFSLYEGWSHCENLVSLERTELCVTGPDLTWKCLVIDRRVIQIDRKYPEVTLEAKGAAAKDSMEYQSEGSHIDPLWPTLVALPSEWSTSACNAASAPAAHRWRYGQKCLNLQNLLTLWFQYSLRCFFISYLIAVGAELLTCFENNGKVDLDGFAVLSKEKKAETLVPQNNFFFYKVRF